MSVATAESDERAHRGRWLSPQAITVLVIVLTLTVAFWLGARSLVDDQERRLLNERSDEVLALLSSQFEQIETVLHLLGDVSTLDDGQAVIDHAAADLTDASTRALGVAAVSDDGELRAVTGLGDAPASGTALSGERAEVVRTAVGTGELVAELVHDLDGETRVILAFGEDDSVAYQEIAIDPAQPVPSTAESAFRELSVALYASETPDASSLVLTTEAELPLTGHVEHRALPIGDEQWTLAMSPRDRLSGPVAQTFPWLLLAGGVITALAGASATEVLVRHRRYALALVDHRTQELRATNAELSETRSFQQHLLTVGPVLVGRIDVPEMALSFVSPNVERMFGVVEGQALVPGALMRAVHDDERPQVAASINRVADGTSPIEVEEFRVEDRDGGYRWVSATCIPDTDDDGTIVAVLVYIIDIDRRRKAELARREAQEAAERANEAKNSFLSRMSHELRTPLNAVLGFGQLLEMDDLTDEQRDAVAHILKGGRHLLDLIDEVLDIARIESGDLSLSPEPVATDELVGEAVDLVRPLARERGVQLVTHTESCRYYVYADRQRAMQIVLNLLSNAVKYNRVRGTVALSCRELDGERLAVEVADTGQGIHAEQLDQLFTPFERLGAEHSEVEGTGIGLALCQRLSEAMGGRITVESEIGQGSTFTLELPLVEGQVERYERLDGDGAATEVLPRPDVVLHIEDNLSSLTLVERIFAGRVGVEVLGAMQGRLGIDLARQHRPALVLLDLHLPDLGGEQVLQRLRDDPATASIPVVIVSADATPGQIRRLLAAGAAGYLTKPIEVSQLLTLFEEAVGERDGR